MATIISRNPANGETLREIELTPLSDIPGVFEKARLAQIKWNSQTPLQRSRFLLQLRETIINRTPELEILIATENGKPRFEALANEIIPVVDMLTFFAKKSQKILSNRPIPLTLMKHRKSYLNYWPLGVVAVISPWNYPFLLPFGQILMALVAGNAVIFKPSEITPSIGLKIQELCNEAGLLPNVLQTLIGDGSLGSAIVEQKPNKIFFTGSTATGRKIMTSAAKNLIPVNLELGGKDSMIVLADADIDFATSAALWGGFSNSGQVCASTERIFIHESISDAFVRTLKAKIAQLRQGPSISYDNDLGVITSEKQKAIYQQQIEEAKSKNADFIAGGTFSADNNSLKPTLVTGPKIESLDIFKEETFGPVVAITTFKSISEAIDKTNQSKFGLLASVITKNIALGEEVAKQLAVGTVTINEVTYTAGLGETPWGGIKESGIGRTHSAEGLYEFVNTRHIHKPKLSLFVFKSMWWFPYSPFQYTTFKLLLNLYRRSWIEKFRTIPHFMWNLVKFIKTEKRL